MKILGLGLGYLSTAVLSIDGKIVSAISEERFTRKKNEEGYPRTAIDYCLESNGLKASDLDKVIIAGEKINPTAWITKNYSSFSIEDHLRAQNEYWYPRLIEGKDVKWLDVFADKADYEQFPGNWLEIMKGNTDHHGIPAWEKLQKNLYRGIVEHLGISESIIEHVEHHTCHAAYAYWGSPFRTEQCLVFTADAYGDGLSATISVVNNGKIERIKAIPHDEFKLGRIYRYITLLLGMKPAEHEYKVMGLAPYAKDFVSKKALEAFQETMSVDGLGFKWNVVPKDLYHHFKEKLEGCRFDGIAGGLQIFTEEILSAWIKNAIKETGINRIVFSGGVSMNVKANMVIHGLDEVEDFFVSPSGGDESLPIGACYHEIAKNLYSKGGVQQEIAPIQAYLGSSYSVEEIKDWIKNKKLSDKYCITENVSDKQVAEILAKGDVIGRMVGEMEFGARSLGNRAILADPRRHDAVEKINKKIKNRDFWMPFAPTILAEYIYDYVENPKKIQSPFMTIGFESTEEGRLKLPAALHAADKTMRPQILEKEFNPRYHALISEFNKLTDVAGLLNTSFNLHGSPIVRDMDDALHVFENSDIDCILLEDILIKKKSI
tara:strand:- start:251047 stop:252858 length:1812 start_codon:yes stop_codon:yes gene_type:complete